MNGTPPELSVIIASINGRGYLEACLDALERQEDRPRFETIVADCVGAEVEELIRRHPLEVRLLAFDEPRSVPELRAAGILAAGGQIVAITEDHCIPDRRWCAEIVASHSRHAEPAIGGAVDNAATERCVDWAVFFCEYSNFISPVPDGVVDDLPGPNVSYKRRALEETRDLIEGGYWETFLHWRLQERGAQLRSDPSICVLHKKHFTLGDFLSERFHYGRAFAGTRNEFVSVAKRIVYLLGSPLLPPILVVRIARRVLRRRRHFGVFLLTLPWIGLFMLAWAAGEWVGYAFGPGRSSLRLS